MIQTPTVMRREIGEIPGVVERILGSPDLREVAGAIVAARPRWIAIAWPVAASASCGVFAPSSAESLLPRKPMV